MSAKSAAKLAAQYAKMKPLPATEPMQHPNLETPTELRQGKPGVGLWDVYFNGSLQHLCSYANRETGQITRYLHGNGNKPTTKMVENLRGIVTFVRKGQPFPMPPPGEVSPYPPVPREPALPLHSKSQARRVLAMGSSPQRILAAAALVAAGVQIETLDGLGARAQSIGANTNGED